MSKKLKQNAKKEKKEETVENNVDVKGWMNNNMKKDIGRYIVCDMEFTCGETRDFPKEIISIGAYKIENGEVIDTYSRIIQPISFDLAGLTQFCKEFTGIKQEEVDNGITYKTFFKEFKEFIGDDVLVTWSDNDKEVFINESKKASIPEEEYEFILNHRDVREDLCTLKNIVGESKKYPKLFKLEYALRKLNIEIEGKLHNAEDDAYNTYKIAKELYN